MKRRAAKTVILGAFLAVLACGGDDGPTDPPAPAASKVVVSSPIDTLIDLDGTVRLAAEAFDEDGNPVSTAGLEWTSSNPAFATVNSSGLVDPVAVGSVEISAELDGIGGSLQLRIVQADLEGISAILGDPYLEALVVGLSETVEANVRGALTESTQAASSGNLVQLLGGLRNARQIAAEASDPTDKALTSVVRLLADHAERLLNL